MTAYRDDYIFKTDFIIGEMRVLVEGALLLFEEELPPLHLITSRQSQLEATQTLNAIESALSTLREHLRGIQHGYIGIAERWDEEDAHDHGDGCKINTVSPDKN